MKELIILLLLKNENQNQKKDFNEGVERMPDRRTSMKNLNINFKFRNNLSKTDLDTIINEPQDKKKKIIY